MIKPEDLRTGDLVRVSRDCAFPKGTMCVISDINPLKVFNDKKGVVSLSAINDDDDGPWGVGVERITKSINMKLRQARKIIKRSERRTANYWNRYDVRPSNVLLLTLIDERIRRAERIVRKFSRAIPPEPLGREI